MAFHNYDFRQFQVELAALDCSPQREQAPKPAGKNKKTTAAAEQLARARQEFLALRARHDLTVADVVSFFPEEEGITYLQQLLAAAETKPRRTRKSTPAA